MKNDIILLVLDVVGHLLDFLCSQDLIDRFIG